MRITICELPHEPAELEAAWTALIRHAAEQRSELVLLPELAMVEPFWERAPFDEVRWAVAEATGEQWLERLGELGVRYVMGTRAASQDGRHFNEGFLWTREGGVIPLRRKYLLPDEPGGWEAHWFDKGDPQFPIYTMGDLTFGLNVCTELWAVETYGEYARQRVQVIFTPRATSAATTAKWMSAGTVAAVRSGAFSISSNRIDEGGGCGGVGWIISPTGQLLELTTRAAPFATVDIDLAFPAAAREQYPGYVFAEATSRE